MNKISDLTTLNLPIVSVGEFDINNITEKMDSNPAVPDCRSNVHKSKSVPPVSETGSVLLGGVPAEICRIYPQRQVSHAARGPNPQITAGRLVCLFHITARLFEGFPPAVSARKRLGHPSSDPHHQTLPPLCRSVHHEVFMGWGARTCCPHSDTPSVWTTGQ